MKAAKRLESGSYGWIALTALVAGYDVYAAKTGRETLSGAFFRGVEHPWKRWPVILTWGLLTGHLFHLIPRRYDPIHQIGLAAMRVR